MQFLYPLFYFVFGVLCCLYVILLSRKTNKSRKLERESKAIKKFYLNIFILNKDEALANVIKNKMSNKFIGGLVGSLAGNLVNDDKFSKMMGDKMCDMIPQRLEDIGIKCNVEVGYTYKSYLCVVVNILTADARRVIEKRGGKEKLQRFDTFLDIFGMQQLNNSIDDTLAVIIGDRMQEVLPKGIREKMADKMGLDVRVVSCAESEQTDFFLATLREIKSKDD